MNNFIVRKVAVLGAGVMGAQIAAHLVNARVDVILYDLPAKDGDKNGVALKAIDGLRGQMTILAITHRPALIRAADAVYVMDEGRIVEASRPREAAALPESYLGRMTR